MISLQGCCCKERIGWDKNHPIGSCAVEKSCYIGGEVGQMEES
jgi:hypothetical protein